MFGLKKKGSTQPFMHADNCRIVKAEPRRRDPVEL